MAYFNEKTLTTVQDLWKNLSMAPSDLHKPTASQTHSFTNPQLHKPELIKEEEEILEFYKGWASCLNNDFLNDTEAAKKFYDMPQVITFDLFGMTPRGPKTFEEHLEETFPYFADAQVDFKNLEVTATSPTSGYSTMIQRLRGKSADGKPFEMTYRISANLVKKNGVWKWVHEHVSFPVNMATKEADFTSSIDPKKNFSL